VEIQWLVESAGARRDAGVRSRPIALEVVGELSALLNGDTVVITAEHSTILVDLPKLRTGLVAWRTVGRRAQQGITMQRVVATLEFTDLTVQFRLAGRTVARLGAEAHPGWLSWLLGVRPLEIKPSGVVALVRALLPRPF
jgi:hypothetical protein